MFPGTDHDDIYYGEDDWPYTVIGPYALDDLGAQLRARRHCGWPNRMVWRAIAPDIETAREIIQREISREKHRNKTG